MGVAQASQAFPYNKSILKIHLLKPDHLPLKGLRVKRQVCMHNLSLELQRSGLRLASRNGPIKAVPTGGHGEVGERELERVASGNGGTSYKEALGARDKSTAGGKENKGGDGTAPKNWAVTSSGVTARRK